MRRVLKTVCSAVLVLQLAFAAAFTASAAVPDSLVPVGDTVGLQIKYNGVMVAGLPAVEPDGEAGPAEKAGIRQGDIITSVNGRTVSGSVDFMAAAADMDGSAVELMVNRDGREICFTVSPAINADGGYQLGLWLREGICGIGTVTYFDPSDSSFGALGHGINDVDTGRLAELGQGEVYSAQVVDVEKGAAGAPGELCGRIDMDNVIGSIDKNSCCGIFGSLSVGYGGQALPVAEESEIAVGPASILSNVSGSEVREYAVEICRVYRNSGDGRSMMLRITDPELLRATGGIVQGMSGSPIIQNGKLVGAVTHVLVNSPDRGYGTSIEQMLACAGDEKAGNAA